MGDAQGHSLPGREKATENIEKVDQMFPVTIAHRAWKAFAF